MVLPDAALSFADLVEGEFEDFGGGTGVDILALVEGVDEGGVFGEVGHDPELDL